MKRMLFVAVGLLLLADLPAQPVAQRLKTAFRQFESDSQLSHAISSLYVIDAKTGQTVFAKNQHTGLAPASTQKIITSVTALELLGEEYRYQTILSYDGKIESGVLEGNLHITGSGDPTLGSWRWKQASPVSILDKWLLASRQAGINTVKGKIIADSIGYETAAIPDGWIWQDIGNYYGAGADPLNWRENQFDIILQSGKQVGSTVTIKKMIPEFSPPLLSEVKAAGEGSGDNAYVYIPVGNTAGIIKGTIPINQPAFKISGAIVYPAQQLITELRNVFGLPPLPPAAMPAQEGGSAIKKIISSYASPSLDSIIYWFNKKSINLYGEALVKTIAFEKTGFGSTGRGLDILKDFWQQRGIDEDELNMRDGSGLSPLNRVTTHAQVAILKYALTRPWYPAFYDAIPEYNGMKMKSGTISDVKGFCGYHKAKDGKEYIFSFLVNNYNGSAAGLVNKMYKVLDLLK